MSENCGPSEIPDQAGSSNGDNLKKKPLTCEDYENGVFEEYDFASMSGDEILNLADAMIKNNEDPEHKKRWIKAMLAAEGAGYDPNPMKAHPLKETFEHIEFTTQKWKDWVSKQRIDF